VHAATAAVTAAAAFASTCPVASSATAFAAAVLELVLHTRVRLDGQVQLGKQP